MSGKTKKNSMLVNKEKNINTVVEILKELKVQYPKKFNLFENTVIKYSKIVGVEKFDFDYFKKHLCVRTIDTQKPHLLELWGPSMWLYDEDWNEILNKDDSIFLYSALNAKSKINYCIRFNNLSLLENLKQVNIDIQSKNDVKWFYITRFDDIDINSENGNVILVNSNLDMNQKNIEIDLFNDNDSKFDCLKNMSIKEKMETILTKKLILVEMVDIKDTKIEKFLINDTIWN